MSKHTIVCETQEDRLRYIHRHDTWEDMLEALKKVDPLVKSILQEAHNEATTDWGLVNDGLCAITKAIAKAEGKS